MSSPRYAPTVLGAMNALRALIEAEAAAHAVQIGGAYVGLKARAQNLEGMGVYVAYPDDVDPKFLAGHARETHLHIPVLCECRDYADLDGTTHLANMVGCVVDAVGTDPTITGTGINARVVGVDARDEEEPSGMRYSAVVTIQVLVQHKLKTME